MNTAPQLYGSQIMYDLAAPEHETETPDMTCDIVDLLNSGDADLVTYEQFKQVAMDRIWDLLDDDYVFEFLRQCSVSLDLNTRDAAKPIRKALEQIAGEMLDEAWHELIKEAQEP